MKPIAVIRLRADGTAEWLDPIAGTPRSGPLTERPDVNGPVTVLVPGEDVLVARVDIAARQRQRLLQAVPYALEDQLMDEVDQVHFALGEAVSGGHVVAAVARERMAAWLEQLDEAGVDAAAIVPDTAAVPRADREHVVLLDGERALVRASDGSALVADRGELDAYLELIGAERVRVLGAGDDPLVSMEYGREQERDPALKVLAGAARSAVNLRQGDFARDDGGSQGLRRLWFIAAALLLVAVCAETIGRGLAVWQKNNHAEAVEAEVNALLTGTFPEINRVVDARIQMQQALDRLRGTGSSGSLTLLRLAGPALAGDAQVRVEGMTYRQGSLLVELSAADLRRIEAVRQRLSGLELAARIESANTLEDKVTARIRIGGGS
ncbi:MAG: type II secretion system protein GspL [Pseudomonadota bacterium]